MSCVLSAVMVYSGHPYHLQYRLRTWCRPMEVLRIVRPFCSIARSVDRHRNPVHLHRQHQVVQLHQFPYCQDDRAASRYAYPSLKLWSFGEQCPDQPFRSARNAMITARNFSERCRPAIWSGVKSPCTGSRIPRSRQAAFTGISSPRFRLKMERCF